MSVIIGHASIDERGKGSGGQAGDQTGKEVCTRSWYNANWNVLLRPKSPLIAEKMARFCEAVCANDNVGYDRWERNTLRRQALLAGWDASKITTPCETDCSAFMTVCAEAAGINVEYTSLGNSAMNAPVTQTMRAKFCATGAFDALTDSRYLVSDRYLRRGDILVRESGHTAMALSNGDLAGAWNYHIVEEMEEIQMTGTDIIDKLSDKQAYTLLEKAMRYAADLPIATDDHTKAEYQDAIDAGITDGSAPMQFATRWQSGLMAYRAMVTGDCCDVDYARKGDNE